VNDGLNLAGLRTRNTVSQQEQSARVAATTAKANDRVEAHNEIMSAPAAVKATRGQHDARQ